MYMHREKYLRKSAFCKIIIPDCVKIAKVRQHFTQHNSGGSRGGGGGGGGKRTPQFTKNIMMRNLLQLQ